MKILLISIAVLFIAFIAVFLTLPNAAKINCDKIDKYYCNSDDDCVCNAGPCLGVVNKNYSLCEEIRQNMSRTATVCTDTCPPMIQILGMEWKPSCLNNKCTNAYVNESFICTYPINCIKR